METGGDGLADIDIAGHHDAVDRGIDRGIAEIELGRGQCGHRLIHLRLRDFNLGLGVAEVCGGEVEIRLRDELLPEQGRHAIEFEFPLIRHVLRFRQIATPALERCAGLTHPSLGTAADRSWPGPGPS